jgi:hypothetical protein
MRLRTSRDDRKSMGTSASCPTRRSEYHLLRTKKLQGRPGPTSGRSSGSAPGAASSRLVNVFSITTPRTLALNWVAA